MKKTFTLIIATFLLYNTYSQSNGVSLVPVVTNLSFPLGLENCGDSRLFIVQKGGKIIVSDSVGNKMPTPYLDITDRTNSSTDEGGLLGLAFDPHYLSNGYFYVDYVNQAGNTQISRFRVNPKNLNTANPNSEKKLLEIPQPYHNHFAGCIRFGPDGDLYIATGDGDATDGNPLNTSQNTMSLLGKILRIRVKADGTYIIPATNPFIDSSNYRKEIWALGLRNPWRFSFDAINGNMYIADAGEALWEEVDVHKAKTKAGQNFGWHCYEGTQENNPANCLPKSSFTFPIYEYTHAAEPGANDCVITGGFVYRGSQYPDLYGKYFFTDWCSGILRTLTFSGKTTTKQDVYSGAFYTYTSFGEDYKHELYVVSSADYTIFKIVSTASVTAVKANPQISMSVYPNPSEGQFAVQYSTGKAEECLLSVYSSNGKRVYSEKKTSMSGNNSWEITLPSFVKGNCYVMISTLSGGVLRQNIIVH